VSDGTIIKEHGRMLLNNKPTKADGAIQLHAKKKQVFNVKQEAN
jgi:hypothetical protein